MSRQIPAMPPEEDRHMMIYSQGNLEPLRPEPPSRSPSPDLPPNFVPKPPVESSSFPAASNIISLLTRMSGGASLRDLIVVPAATWDRNNTMWEHKMAQLRKKHRKDWAEKEVELRRKYDEQYSDARYREMLLSKEMKEMEFARGVAGGGVLGKTWKEHKVAKKEMERTYVEKLKEKDEKLGESEATIEKLQKALAEKETAIEALQNAIGRRGDRTSAEPQQLKQLQLSQQFQQFQQQQQHPQYQLSQLNSNIANTQGPSFSSTPQAFLQQSTQPLLPTFQYPPQQQQQQQPDQSMALVRASTFGSVNSSGTNVHPSFNASPSVGDPFKTPSVIVSAFNSVSGPNPNIFRPTDQGKQDGKCVENRQQGDLWSDSRSPQGHNEYQKTGGTTRGDDFARGRHHDHGGSRSGRNHISRANEERNTSSHLQVPVQDRASSSRSRSRGRSENRLDSNPGFHLDVRPDIIRPEHPSESRPRHNTPASVSKTAAGDAIGQYSVESSGSSSWNDIFPTPQCGSVATKGSSQPNIESTPFRQPHSASAKSTPNLGLKSPFGVHSQAVVSSGSPAPFRAIAGSSLSGFGINYYNPRESPGKKTANEVTPFQVSSQELPPDTVMREVSLEGTEPLRGVLKAPGSRKSSGLRAVSFEGQKRPHSISPPSRRVNSRVTQSQQEGEENSEPAQRLYISEDEVSSSKSPATKGSDLQKSHLQTTATKSLRMDRSKNAAVVSSSVSPSKRYPVDTAMDEEELDKAIEDTRIEYSEPNTHAPDLKGEDDLVSEVDLTSHEEMIAANLIKASFEKQRVLCITLKKGVTWPGPQYIMNKVRGGALETVHVYDKDREVFISFADSDAAQKFHDFFNKDPDAKEAFIRFKLLVRWASDSIRPISPEIALSIASGATRCLKIFQIPNDRLAEDIKTDFSPNKGPHEVLSVHLGTEKSRRKNNGGMGKFVTVEFFTIQLALNMKEKIENGEMVGYQDCDVEFSDDPCEKKDGGPWPIDSMRTWSPGKPQD